MFCVRSKAFTAHIFDYVIIVLEMNLNHFMVNYFKQQR